MNGTTISAAGVTKPEGALLGHVIVVKSPLRGRPPKPRQSVSREAQRIAAALLEVLAGVRTPTDAAAALNISVPRYYIWEKRALEGFVSACEPRSPGEYAGQQHEWRSFGRRSFDCGRTARGKRPWCGPRSGRSAWRRLRNPPRNLARRPRESLASTPPES